MSAEKKPSLPLLTAPLLTISAAVAILAGEPASAQLPACSGGSTGLVLSVTPASNGATLQRGGASAPLMDLSVLCAGDVISLGSGETALVDVQDGRGSNEPLVGPTSYQVPGGGGMAGNATAAVAQLLFPESSTRTRTLVSRSDGAAMSPRPENLSARLPQELAVTPDPRALWFGWTGGAAPFHVTLETAAGDVLAESDISAAEAAAIRAHHTGADGVVAAVPYDVTFAPVALPPGDYVFKVSDANSEPPEVAALMSDEEAGVMSVPLKVVDGLAGVPLRTPDGAARSDIDLIVEATCFSLSEPESRLFEAAQHVVAGRDGAPYAAALATLGDDQGDANRAALCQ
jgi:hypothetical protein